MNHAKKTLIYFICHTLVGLIALMFMLLGQFPDSYRESITSGIAGGFIISGLFGIISCVKLLKDPQKATKVEIAKNEERAQFIRMKTNSATYTVTIFIESVCVILAGLLGFKEISISLACLSLAKIAINLGFAHHFSHKY
ncbi:hypothetical protein GTO89_16330 [Heliobacterium gestii]|uniref:Uncharacterized protein n=1 Tax=Heliomicrobium gestii TaxID=2699 RepID=A0A845LEK5_HELGE|nr:hypothetical protein [Heliomicrobium gestii]MBM7868476.1 uncharacterized membrane protein HdeD (DUF308 family) [Heliomicrobium gestii]MZP44598.1 hypothetical protein [Heliomicrobium gestii]